MFKNIFPVLLISISFHISAQQYKVKWGKLEKRTGALYSIIPRSGDDFFALRRTGGGVFGSLKLSKHKALELIASGKISLKVNESMANFEDVTCIGDHLMVFLSDKKDKKNQLFMQEYGEDLKPKGKPIKLGEYEIPKGRSNGSFEVVHSKDSQFFGVIWETYNRKESKTSYGFHIYDNELNTVSEGNYELPYDSNLSKIYANYLSNTGDYFISILEYSEPEEQKLFQKHLNYKAFHITHITPDGLEDFTLDIEGKRIEAMEMQSDDDHLFTITGIYGAENKSGISGVFYMRVDFNKQEIVDKGFEEFGKDFITQDWSDRQKIKADKKERKGKGEPQLFNYEMREATVLKDGSIVASMEQYYVLTSTYTDPRTGSTRTTYTYYYNDIIAFKVGANGGFDWLKKINKQQVSTNDWGSYSSYARFIDDGKLYFIFNDNIKNYTESGKFIDGEIYASNFGKRKNTVGLVEVDLNTGDVNRQSFFNGKEITSLAIPKLFITDYITKQLILYTVSGRKEMFGVINFKE
jgi:hypothetical protein